MKIKAVVFDLDGTLYACYRMYLHSVLFFIFHSRFIYHYSKIRKSIRKTSYTGAFRKVQAELLAERLKMPADFVYRKVERIIYDRWERIFRNIRPLPGVRRALSFLRRKKIKLGVMSDFPVQKKLNFLGLDGIWSCAFSSEETGYLKPHEKPFREISERLKIKPENILYVGDKLRYDIEGAKRAGLRTAFYSKKESDLSDFTFSSYKEFLVKIRNISGS